MQTRPHFSCHSNRRTNIRMFKQQFREAQLSSDMCMRVCMGVCVCFTSKNAIDRFTNGP